MVDEWADRQSLHDPEIEALSRRQDVLQEEIIRRLGKDGRDMMESLADLNLRVETIHDQALFRAAMQLGAQIAQPSSLPSAGEAEARTALRLPPVGGSCQPTAD